MLLDEEIGLKVRLRLRKSKVATILSTDKSSKGHAKGTTLSQDCEEASEEMRVLFHTDVKDKTPKQRGTGTGKKAKQSFKSKSRDNDLHRLLFMPNGLPDGAELAYYVKGHKLLVSYKQGNGIVCGCCDVEISPSQFEAHAGIAARRQPGVDC
ncbi:unnamed protein product [Trifolium pratense]|uniref:Uncharacterized protein n=1 Tax=Trifolium pratense TaxID=57577 RepID=A0ACB0KLI7_TRIPR|nr:unnamed protein product [Trifolium pratense]